MRKHIPMLVALCLASLLSACGEHKDGPIGAQSIDWYKSHKDERAQQLAWCKEQSMTVQMNSQGCSQASKAQAMSFTHGAMPAGY